MDNNFNNGMPEQVTPNPQMAQPDMNQQMYGQQAQPEMPQANTVQPAPYGMPQPDMKEQMFCQHAQPAMNPTM